MKSLKKIVLLGFIALGFSLFGPRPAMAGSKYFTVVSTVAPNGAANGATQFTAASYPNITGGLYVRKIVVSSVSGALAGQEFQIFDTCTSSTAATQKFSVVALTTATVNLDFLPQSFRLTSPCFSRGAQDLNATIRATVFYE